MWENIANILDNATSCVVRDNVHESLLLAYRIWTSIKKRLHFLQSDTK